MEPEKLKQKIDRIKKNKRRSPQKRLTSEIVKGYFHAKSIINEEFDFDDLEKINYRDLTKNDTVNRYAGDFIETYIVPFEEKNAGILPLGQSNYFSQIMNEVT